MDIFLDKYLTSFEGWPYDGMTLLELTTDKFLFHVVRGRTKKLVESLHKLNKYSDAMNSHKYQRNEFLTSEKSGGLLLPKNGAQLQQSIQEDRAKNVNSNKRVRTAVADSRVCH